MGGIVICLGSILELQLVGFLEDSGDTSASIDENECPVLNHITNRICNKAGSEGSSYEEYICSVSQMVPWYANKSLTRLLKCRNILVCWQVGLAAWGRLSSCAALHEEW